MTSISGIHYPNIADLEPPPTQLRTSQTAPEARDRVPSTSVTNSLPGCFHQWIYKLSLFLIHFINLLPHRYMGFGMTWICVSTSWSLIISRKYLLSHLRWDLFLNIIIINDLTYPYLIDGRTQDSLFWKILPYLLEGRMLQRKIKNTARTVQLLELHHTLPVSTHLNMVGCCQGLSYWLQVFLYILTSFSFSGANCFL